MPAIIKGKKLLASKQNSPSQAFTLHIIANGYENETSFLYDCRVLKDRLFKRVLGKSDSQVSWLNIITYFDPASTFSINNSAPTFQSNGLETWLDKTNHKLVINYAQFENYLPNLYTRFDADNQGFLSAKHRNLYNGKGDWPGVIIILIPDVSENPYNLNSSFIADVEMEHMPTSAEPHYFAATAVEYVTVVQSEFLYYDQVVARAMGLALGLGSEYDTPDVDASSTAPTEPTENQGFFVDMNYFNLMYLPQQLGNTVDDAKVEGLKLKWFDLFEAGSRPHVPVHKHPNPAVMDTSKPIGTYEKPLELWEGGGGFRKKIYRSAHDCIMRRKPGSRLLPIRNHALTFCPACQVVIEKAANGTLLADNTYQRKNIHNQKLKIDEVSWTQKDIIKPVTQYVPAKPYNSPPLEIQSDGAAPAPTTKPYWNFSFSVTPSGGLQLFNLQVNTQGASHAGDPVDGGLRNVMKEINFKDLKIFWENDILPPTDFLVADGLNGINGEAELKITQAGERPGDNNFQYGFALTLKQTYGTNSKQSEVEVTVVQSVVLRAPVADFEGGGVALGMKVFPEVSFCWKILKPGTNLRVRRFEANVVFDVNTRHYMAPAPGHEGHDMPIYKSNYVGFFNDSNATYDITDTRPGIDRPGFIENEVSLYNQYLPILPTWAALFDYVKTDVTNQTTIQAVYGPEDNPDKYRKTRKTIVKDYGISSSKMQIRKVPRQGYYDNMHVHGYMGKHFETDTDHFNNWEKIPIAEKENRVAAPFCGMDCLHTHWRWGELNEQSSKIGFFKLTNNTRAQSFRGWSDHVRGAVANINMSGALIPPNQSLVITVRNKDASNQSLDPELKVVEHKFSVSNPSINEVQVLFEFGTAWAMDFNIDWNLFWTMFAFLPWDALDPFVPFVTDDVHKIFNDIYDEIRYFSDPNFLSKTNWDQTVILPLKQRVPQGTLINDSITLEQL